MSESSSDQISRPSHLPADSDKPGLDLKPPFWIILGIFVGTLVVWLIGSRLIGLPATAVVAFAAGGAGWYFLKQAQQSGQVQRWHWMLVGGGSFVTVQALLALFYLATDIAFIEILLVILGAGGFFGSFIAVIVMLIIAATKRSDAAVSANPTQGQMVSPITGYSSDGQPIYGQPVVMQSRSVGTNVFAILALVFGLLGGVLGIVFGHIALSQIRRTGEEGRALAIAGLVLGYLFLVGWLFFVIALVDAAS